MPRKLTIECTCDRCGRIWYEDYTEGEEPPSTPSLEARFVNPGGSEPGIDVKFEVLCEGCSVTLWNYVEKLGELKHRSPKKSGAKKERPKKDRPSRKGATPRARASSSGSSKP